MLIDDLDDFTSPPERPASMMLVRKTQEDKIKEEQIVGKIVQALAGEGEGSDEDVEGLMATGEKVWQKTAENRDPNMPAMRKWLIEVDVDAIVGEQDLRYTKYMSWQNEKVEDQVQRGEVEVVGGYSDPFVLRE